MFPTEDMKVTIWNGNYGKPAEVALGMVGWDWHTDTASHVLRLFASGLFDKYLEFRIVIGHMGDILPY